MDTNIASDAFDNMKHFMDAVNFKKATLIYLASKLPEGCIEELRQLFIMIDTNGDGRITSDEFQNAIQRYGIDYTSQQMQDLIYMLDTNNNGYIDYTEFLAGCMKSKIYLNEAHLKIAFEYFDKVPKL
jgi:calcium-dependent protein kinase